MSNINLSRITQGFSIQAFPHYKITQEAFSAAESFFSRSPSYKRKYQFPEAEYGYKALKYKEFFIICDPIIPDELIPCLTYANLMHEFSKNCLIQIAKIINLPPENLLSLISQTPITENSRSPSLVRIIHYSGNPQCKHEPMFAADPHQDIGLLTFVPKTVSPALDVYDFSKDGQWLEIENELSGDQIIVLVGETLSKISNNYFIAGVHRVRITAKPRISLVYQLRANPQSELDSSLFETPITGKFYRPFKMTTSEFVANERKYRPSANSTE